MAVADKRPEQQDPHSTPAPLPTGPAAAATLAAGLGVLVLGLMTIGAAISKGLAAFLTWSKGAGPLSGKTSVAVIVWLLSWWYLARKWGRSDVDFGKVWRYALAMLIAGALLMFPPVYEAFGR